MRNRKKIRHSLLLVVLLAFLVACNDSSTSGPTQSDAGNTSNASNSADAQNKQGDGGGQVYHLTITHHDPPESSQARGMLYFMKHCEEQSNGRLEFEIYHSGTLANMNECLDYVRGGMADIGFLFNGSNYTNFPFDVLYGSPGLGVETQAQAGEAMWVGYETSEIYRNEFEVLDIVPIMFPPCDAYPIVTNGKEVWQPSDMKGLVLRSAGGPAMGWLANMGASPISMPMADVYNAVEKGTVNGIICTVSSLDTWKTYEVCDFMLDGAFYYGPQLFFISGASWRNLPSDLQDIMREEGRIAHYEYYDWCYTYNVGLARAGLLENGGSIHEIPAQYADLWEKAGNEGTALAFKDFEKNPLSGGMTAADIETFLKDCIAQAKVNLEGYYAAGLKYDIQGTTPEYDQQGNLVK